MSGDLVERLRIHCSHWVATGALPVAQVVGDMNDAADEISRLQEELAEAKSEVGYVYGREATIHAAGRADGFALAKKMHEALRKLCVTSYRNEEGVKLWSCDQCQGPAWTRDGEERHAPGCLAAPDVLNTRPLKEGSFAIACVDRDVARELEPLVKGTLPERKP